MRKLSLPIPVLLLAAGCVVYQPVPTYTPPPSAPPPPVVYQAPPPPPIEPAPIAYEPPPPAPVFSVYVEPPIDEPPPVACPWAPPPMLVEEPPAPPFADAVWIGGFWVWQGTWVWDHGRWAEAPRPGYHWVHPYYEHRGEVVIFVTGHWESREAIFIAPPRDRDYEVERPLPGMVAGPRPIGPDGVFVPPPPGSRPGIIIPAPIGTAPAVVTSAPPVVNVGMRITNNLNSNNTTVVNNVTNVTNVTNITRVTIVAPASATASGQAVNTSVPAQAHLAAALAPAVRVAAPPPASQQAIPSFARGRPPAALPPPQTVHAIVQAPHHPMAPAPSAAPMAAPRPAPEMTGAPGQRESFDRQEREPREAQRAPTPQPSPNAGAPMHAPATAPAPNPASRPESVPFEREAERRQRVEPRPSTPEKQAVNPTAAEHKPGVNPNVQAPASKPAAAAPSPKYPQNAQEAAAQRKDKPGQAQSGQKREANEKEKETEPRKEGER